MDKTTKPTEGTLTKIGNKEYLVKSVFLGKTKTDMNTAIMRLAEKRALKELGLSD